jgi:hypothetical protein
MRRIASSLGEITRLVALSSRQAVEREEGQNEQRNEHRQKQRQTHAEQTRQLPIRPASRGYEVDTPSGLSEK